MARGMVRSCLGIGCLLLGIIVATARAQDPAPVIGFDMTAITVAEGGPPETVNVSVISGTLTSEVVVTVSIEGGSIGSGMAGSGDYNVMAMELTFNAAVNTRSIAITAADDDILEGDEVFTLNLTTIADDTTVTLDPSSATVTITDMTMVTVGFDMDTYPVTEGGTVTATVSLSPAGVTLNRAVMVTVESSSPDDFTVTPAMITFSDSDRSEDIIISASSDMVLEDPETHTVSLSFTDEDLNVQLSPATATVSITDNTMVTVGFDMGTYTVTEGGETVTATVNLSPAGVTLNRDVMVAVASGSPGDFTVTPAMITFSGSDRSQNVVISATLDTVKENEETASITLTGGGLNVQLDPAMATLTITDNTMVMVSLEMSEYTVEEGNPISVNVVVAEGATLERSVELMVMTQGGSAMAGADFDALPPSLTIPSGSTSGALTVTARDDDRVEDTETFGISLISSDSLVIVTNPSSADINITDTTLVTVGFNMAEYAMTEGGTVTATVNLTPAVILDRSVIVTVEFSSTDDFKVDPTRLIFSGEIRSLDINMSASHDLEPDDDGQMVVISLAGDASNIMTGMATVTITDATILVTPEDPVMRMVTEGENVTLTIATADAITGSFMVTATAVSENDVDTPDLNFTTATFTFSSSDMSHTFTVMALSDEVVEGTRNVIITYEPSPDNVAGNVLIRPNRTTISIMDTTILPGPVSQSQPVLMGESVRLMCTFEAGFDILAIQWLRDGDLPRGDSDTITPDGPGNFTYTGVLDITGVSFLDCGNYSCIAGGVQSESAAELSVVAFNENETSDIMQTSSVGAVGTLSCSIRSCGTFTIVWNFPRDDGTQFPFPIEHTTTAVENSTNLIDRTSVLTINTLGLVNSDLAQECVVEYDEGAEVTRRMFNYTLHNVVVDEITVSPVRNTTTSFHRGDNVTLTCNATSPPNVTRPLVFTWVLGSDELPSKEVTNDTSNGITVVNGEDYAILSFMDIKDDTDIEGLYLCRVTNRERRDWVTVNVTVDVISGPVIVFPDDNRDRVNAGEDVTLLCDTRGSNPDVTSITISSAGVDLKSTTTEMELEYTVMNASLGDNGTNYTCTAVNDLGDNSETFPLIVLARPDMVDNSTVVSTLLSLLVTNLTWSPPLENNSPITSYTVSICNPTTNCLVEQPSAPYLILYVLPEESYTVTITATNGVGTSDPSETVVIYGAMNDDANASLSIPLVTDQFVLLQWSPPRLASLLDDNIIPDEGGQFNVTGYVLKINDETLSDSISGNTMEYLYKVPTGGAGGVIFRLVIVYSDSQINDRLARETRQSVDIPTAAELDIPEINEVIPDPVIPTAVGFTFSWNVPGLLDDLSFLDGYRVMIDEEGPAGRRKRQAMSSQTVGTDIQQYTFDDGEPHTTYSVSVDGLVNRNGVNATVPALTPTPLTTAQDTASPPRDLTAVRIGITYVDLTWNVPASPNGVIQRYQVSVQGGRTTSEGTTTGTSIRIGGLLGHQNYTVTVYAMNGAGNGNQAQLPRITTDAGAFPPEINNVITNLETERYSLAIRSFREDYGPLSYYLIYVIEEESSPDTSKATNSQIALALSVNDFTSTQVMGDGTSGTFRTPDGREIEFNDRELDTGTVYYFFIRLYSSVEPIVNRFNDSTPERQVTIIPSPDKADNTTIIVVAVVLGIVALILVAIFIVIAVILVKSKGYKYIPRRLDDGEKGGIELRRRTRLFTPVLDVGDPNVFTSIGQPTTLLCEVSGTPAPSVKWTHDGKSLDDERFLVLADHSLFIQDTSTKDEGSYLVTAENSSGACQAQIKVTVIKASPPEKDKDHPVIPMDNFTEHYARMTANDGDDLEEEYSEVEPDCPNTSSAAKLSINRNKNRYINIIPYDHSRVVLALQENTPGSDYANASYIDGYKRANQYIATQGPTTSTLADFWRMVWEFDCPTIVMVTKLEEEDKRKCEQYWPSYGSTTYGNVQVTLKEAENLAEYSIRTFSVSPLAGQSSAQMPVREVKQFHFLKWPDHGVPHYATALLHFRKRVHLYHPEKRGPMVVHCSAGVGRTGTFITVDYCMEMMEGEGNVEIFNFVQQMRYKRNYMVQTAPQYEFIHEAINEAITCGDTSIKAPELKEWLAKLEPDSETGKTVLEEQFTRLESASPQDDDFDCTVAEANREKNRIQKHLPSNDQRVTLSSENDMCDYICASFIDGYRQPNAFMITQGPLESTVGDFWRMIWEYKSAAIVTLTQLEEDGEEMCKKYWSDEVGEKAMFGMFHVELTSEVRDLGDYRTRKIKLSPIDKAHESRIVTQFHFTKWSRTVPPDSAKPMIDMIDELQRVQRKSGNQPITVHCNDGLGRTGTFCTLYYVLDRVKTEQVVDVFQAVKTLRIQRTGLVNNLGQFRFVHTATMEFLNTFSDYQNFK